LSDDDLIREAREAFELAADAEAENRRDALDDLRFARLGEQWPEAVRREREREGRPCLTINRLPAFIRQVVNDARQNKPAIVVHPVDGGADPETAEVFNGLIRHIEQSSDAEVAYSRYLALALSGPDAGAWHRGIMARTAFVDAGPTPYPIGVTFDGAAYYHEKGRSADGAAFGWFVETADNYLDPENALLVRGVWPDFKDQTGPVTVSVSARRHPQDATEATTSAVMAAGDAKADLLVTGRLFRARFSGQSAPTGCRIGAPVFDVAPAGRR
jgi:hypothetical protein